MKVIEAKDLGGAVSVAVIASRLNVEVTNELLTGAVQRLQELEIFKDNITVVHVPGVVEIPVTAQRLAKTEKYDVIIALGAVIKGESTLYEYVREQASQGCQRVSLEAGVPVVFGVLMTDNIEQAKERAGGKKGHKGRESADIALEMVSVLKQI